MIVWALIAALVVIAVLETRSRFRFKMAYEALLDGIQQGEQTGKLLVGPDVTTIIGNHQADETRKVQGLVNGASRVDIYHFGGVLQKRTLYVYYGTAGTKGQPEVVAVTDREAELYIPRSTSGPGSSAGGGSGTLEPIGQPPSANQSGSGTVTGSGQRQPSKTSPAPPTKTK